MPAVSLSRRVERLARDMAPGANLIDLGIEVRAPDGRALYRAGGIWDKRLRKYVGESAAPHAIRLVESQLKAGEELARWFQDYEADEPTRRALINCVDERRGGKTVFVVCAAVSFAIKFPRSHLGKTVVWLVTPTYPQQHELHETLALLLPAEWYRDGWIRYYKSENYYQLANGTEIWIKSADRPATLKWGAVALAAVNEAQQVDERGILNIIGSNVDNGGLTILAMNPPDNTKGLWTEELHDALQALDDKGRPLIDFATEVPFPAAKNATLNQAGRQRYLKLAKILSPKQAQRDGLGIWIKLRDTPYPLWNRNQHVREEPKNWTDFTAAANALTKLPGHGQKLHFGAGADWQHYPYCCWVELRVLLAPAGVGWVAKGTPVYVVRCEIMNELRIHGVWDEVVLCQEVAKYLTQVGRKPADYMLVADATGRTQGSSGAQRGQGSDPDSFSFALVRQHGWDPHGTIEERRQIVGKQGAGSRIDVIPSNPRTADRLELVNYLLRENRIVVTPNCQETIESFRRCEVKNKKPYGRWSHLPDALGYPIFAWEKALREAGIVKVVNEPDDLD